MSALAHAPSRRILPAVLKLLLLRVRISWNSFRHAKTSRKIGTIFITLLLVAFAGFIFFLSWLLLGFLRSPNLTQYVGLDATRLLESMPVLILAALFVGILLTSFGVLLQALYLSRDMDFLLSSPVPLRAVFVAKLLQAVLPNFALIALFGLPVLFGLGIASNYNILYYPLVVLEMVILTLAAAGLSALLVMLVVRVLPPRRAAEILGFLGATLGMLCSQMGNFSNWASDNVDVSGEQASSLFRFLMRLDTVWLPLNWAGRGLVDIGEGRWLSGILFAVLTLGLAGVTFLFALATAERWYYSGWAGMQVVERKKKTAREKRPHSAEQTDRLSPLARLIPNPVRAILVKDFMVLRRDLRNLSQLISPLILGALYTLMLFRGRGGVEFSSGQGNAPAWFMEAGRLVLDYSSIGMSLFVGWMLLSRLAGMGFSAEGRNYWMIKVSPVHSRHLLAAKFLVAYLPTFLLGLVFLVVITIIRGMSVVAFLYGLLAMTLCLSGMTGILLAFGIAGANFNWDDPRKMNAGGMGCLGQILTMLYLPLAFGLFVGPLGLASALGWPLIYGHLAGTLVGGAVTLACASVPLLVARGRLARLAEG
ncbi:MAG: hypothetical protein JXB85_11320 [Anaerolineales bacterium]|nr:hypothetical protein [Anaerolineales bacterium]